MSNILTDRTALERNRKRAEKKPVEFLHTLAAQMLKDRLSIVKKDFKKTAIITGFGHFWRNIFPEADIIPDSDTLNLDVQSYDLVIHAMGLHWSNDPVGQVIQCQRALQPDGLFMSVSFGGKTLFELRSALAEAETSVAGGLSPRVLPMADIRDMGALLQRCGLTMPVADSDIYDVSYDSPHAFFTELRMMGEANAMANRLRHFTRRSIMTTAAKIYKKHFGTDDGRIRASFEFITLTGWAPDSSQPQPLRPGSARTRLADALNVRETPIKD